MNNVDGNISKQSYAVKLERITTFAEDRVLKLAVESEMTPQHEHSDEFKAEYKENLLALRRSLLNLVEYTGEEVRKLK